jgi:hypothetical protein
MKNNHLSLIIWLNTPVFLLPPDGVKSKPIEESAECLDNSNYEINSLSFYCHFGLNKGGVKCHPES